ncbi:MAG: iron chelate uptake ABC transporter family permease subunit, partial [Prolixibacteraceae bacterium]|nr:iron chelate uptake ABC transporter family permease subunit [Prolixibacteraceae bacterium]
MPEKIVAQYKKFIRRRVTFMAIIVVLLVAIAMLALVSGSADTSLASLFKIIAGEGDPFYSQIILSIRLPRVVGAILAGTALAVSGAVIQSLLKNPLASPFTLGISGAAAFGAAFAIIFLGAGSGYSGPADAAIIDNPYVVTLSAFCWSLVSVVVILLLSKYKGATPEVIILSGIIISSLFGAGISAMQYFSDDVQLAAIVFWTFGDMGRATWRETIIMAAVLIPVM